MTSESPAARYTLIGPDGSTYTSPTPASFGGHRRSRLFGRLDCPAAFRAISRGGYVAHRVFFADEAAAVQAGYRPCAVCLPKRYARWKQAAPSRARPEAPASGLGVARASDAHTAGRPRSAGPA
jgi:hypothetical protein